MTSRRWTAIAVLLALLVAVPYAAGAGSAVSTRATLTGSGTTYRMTVVNDGDRPILCFGLLLTGVQPTSATGPTGVLTRVGAFQGRGLVHMQGTAATPAVPVGGTAVVEFRTNVAIATNAGGEIRYSDTCQPGSDVVGQASGPTPPPPPPPPPPKPKPCRCISLDVQLGVPTSSSPRSSDRAIVDLEWALSCTRGTGRCAGRLITELSSASRRADVGLSVLQDGRGHGTGGRWFVTCEGRCFLSRGREVTGAGYIDLRTPPAREFGPRGIATVMVEIERVCRRELTTRRFLIAFNAGGAISVRRSDLNGNGVADGKEKR